ncbi:hypothetical protein K2173_023953 [Erythroxylum novogranatense]|uniref:RING-type E3 ubiquitin transferase n=1 Tax=Erythroxylum novogranatense TaxID=1862640 RepID=A0AAV8TQL0_9ROSI|nr:hypothetical protein K2173_023953 [Erythroxylum novogranatense]
MGLEHRKLLSYDNGFNQTLVELCQPFCDLSNDLGFCEEQCLDYCGYYCPSALAPSPSVLYSGHHSHRLSKLLITALSVLTAAFVLVCCYGVYVKFYSGPRRRRSWEQRNLTTHDEFIDEDHGPVVDHPIWYINTLGLQPSVISSITVCRYIKGDGLVEETDCSVCLNEFREYETLRLLPKCSHAFHINCIDTWLRSHTNCPMCRAPIITNPATQTTTESGTNNSGTQDENQILRLENDAESSRGSEERDGESRIESEMDGELQGESRRKSWEHVDGIPFQPMRRSASLDSLSASKTSHALTNVLKEQSDGNSGIQLAKGNEFDGYIISISSRVGGHRNSSMAKSSPIVPNTLKRSFSWSGKLFTSRYSRGRLFTSRYSRGRYTSFSF